MEKNIYIFMFSASSLNNHLIIRVYVLSSFKDDEPVLAEEEGSSAADSHTAEDRYKTNNFLIHDIAGLARKEIMANCHRVHFKVFIK